MLAQQCAARVDARCRDRAAEAHHREAEAHAVRPPLREARPRDRAAGAAARGAADRAAGPRGVSRASRRPRASTVRRPLPEHLPRERVVHEPACTCPDCGGALRQIGEDVSEVLDYVPARFKVIRHVRPKLACRRASASCRRQRRRGRSSAAWPAPGCSRTCWWRNTPITCRCIGRRRSTRARASSWSARRWPTGSAGCFRLLEPLVEALGALRAGGGEAARRRHAGAGARSGARQDQDRAAVDLRAR